MVTRSIGTSLLLAATLLASGSASAGYSETVATPLLEVKTTKMADREYMTVRISRAVGPSSCRGAVLKVDTAPWRSDDGPSSIESIALSAMLTAEPVLITVPMEHNECLDGMPTIARIRPIPLHP